jgi:long-subunit acyl-CoA synthetase (AMP-forming)
VWGLYLQLVYAMKPGQQLPPTTDRVSAKLYKLEDVAHLGQQHPKAHIPPSPTDLCTICYTSGTTGQLLSLLQHNLYIHL